MNDIFPRELLEFLILVPCAFLSCYPLKNRTRIAPSRFYAAAFLVSFGVSVVGAALSAAWNNLSGIFFFAAVAVCCVLFCVLVSAELPKKIFCLANASMLGSFATTNTNFLTAPIEDENPLFTLPSGLICLGIAALLIPLFYRTLTEKLAMLLYDERRATDWWLLTLIALFLTVLLVWMTPSDVDFILNSRVRPLALVGLPLFPIAALLLYHLLWQTTVRLTDNARLEEENNLLQIERKRYDALRAYMDETRILRHDFRHHLIVMSQLSAEGKTEELDSYLRQLNENASVEHVRYCANPAVDAIAARYTDLAAVRGIRLIWDLELGEELPVQEADYCGALGNLVDNAIRAVSEEPEDSRWVKIFSKMISDAMLGLSVENPCSRKIEFSDGLPRTDRSGHGVGMTSVAATVRRYRGTMEVKNEGGLFSVNILFCFH